MRWFGLVLFGKPVTNQTNPYLSTLETIPGRLGSGSVRSGWVGPDDGNSDNRANSGQLEQELGLSLGIIGFVS